MTLEILHMISGTVFAILKIPQKDFIINNKDHGYTTTDHTDVSS